MYFQVPSPTYGAEITYWVGGAAPARAGQDAAQQGGGRGGSPQARIAILDSRGDTVQALNGPATRGLQRVTWNFRADAETLPLSPSERRDSIATERRLAVVTDSLVRAGTTRAAVDSAVAELRRAGQGGGGRGGGGGGGGGDGTVVRAGEFTERPAEEPARGGGPGGRGGGGGGGGGGDDDDDDLSETITRLVRGDTGRGGRGGGGSLFPRRTAGPAPIAEPGTYTVVVTVGGRTLTQPLQVERGPAAPTR
jgi:hypothetical protein